MCAEEAGRWGSYGLAGLDGLQSQESAHLTGLGKTAFPEQPVGHQNHGTLSVGEWQDIRSVLRLRGL